MLSNRFVGDLINEVTKGDFVNEGRPSAEISGKLSHEVMADVSTASEMEIDYSGGVSYAEGLKVEDSLPICQEQFSSSTVPKAETPLKSEGPPWAKRARIKKA